MNKLLFLIVFVLSACAPSSEAINTAMAQTQAAIPTATIVPTPTRIPLEEIDLEALLILPGDLPADFEGQQIRQELPARLRALETPEGVNSASQAFRNGEWASEGVTIVLYETAAEIEDYFRKKLNMELPPIEGMEERSIVNSGGALCDGCSIQVVFIRCNALVYIDIFDQLASHEDVLDTVSTYAKRLDKRLEPLVC